MQNEETFLTFSTQTSESTRVESTSWWSGRRTGQSRHAKSFQVFSPHAFCLIKQMRTDHACLSFSQDFALPAADLSRQAMSAPSSSRSSPTLGQSATSSTPCAPRSTPMARKFSDRAPSVPKSTPLLKSQTSSLLLRNRAKLESNRFSGGISPRNESKSAMAAFCTSRDDVVTPVSSRGRRLPQLPAFRRVNNYIQAGQMYRSEPRSSTEDESAEESDTSSAYDS